MLNGLRLPCGVNPHGKETPFPVMGATDKVAP